MLTVEITNDQTGTDESANYEYVVRVNWREIARGKVSGHNRKDEWWKLLNLVVQHATRSEPKRGAEGPNHSAGRYCRECYSELNESNLIKKGDQICRSCKELRFGKVSERYNARMGSDFRIKYGQTGP